ncbi:MAG: hypothetical protein ACK5KR_00345 [Breznakia sp.]
MMQEYLDTLADNEYRRSLLGDGYIEQYDEIVAYVMKMKDSKIDKKILLSYVLREFEKAQDKKLEVNSLNIKSIAAYVAKISKHGIQVEEKKHIMNRDYEKYTVSSIWQAVTAFIVLVFLRNYLNDNYLINFSVDVAVAIFATIILFASLKIKLRILKKYNISMKYMYMDITALVLCVFIKYVVDSNVDITFALLVLETVVIRRLVKGEFDRIVSNLR